ncbi:unnamed protein product, partial [Rotaria sp. Silwood2]
IWNDVYKTEKLKFEENQRENKLKFIRSENNIWKFVNKSFKKYSPPFRGLKTSNGIIKDSEEIVEILADHYEKHFSLPITDLNNSHHSKSLEASNQIS